MDRNIILFLWIWIIWKRSLKISEKVTKLRRRLFYLNNWHYGEGFYRTGTTCSFNTRYSGLLFLLAFKSLIFASYFSIDLFFRISWCIYFEGGGGRNWHQDVPTHFKFFTRLHQLHSSIQDPVIYRRLWTSSTHKHTEGFEACCSRNRQSEKGLEHKRNRENDTKMS